MQRYPPTRDRSLRVFSAADELLLEWAATTTDCPLTVVNDPFGALALSHPGPVHFISSSHGQEEALRRNAIHLGVPQPPCTRLLDEPPRPLIQRAVLRIPKSIELFDFYLDYLVRRGSPDLEIAAGFMTRHFTPAWLEVAGRYAGQVTQSRARRKARLLHLTALTAPPGGAPPQLNELAYGGRVYRQYPGVFSGKQVDFATQFLLNSWEQLGGLPVPSAILDVACGNGIIGDQLLLRYPSARLTAVDDFLLAVKSAELNLPPPPRATVRYQHRLDDIPSQSQDLIVINPPFHFGYTNTIDISLSLFAQMPRVLRPGGHLVIVANQHLNYATQLRARWTVEPAAQNERFIVYRCALRDQPNDL